MREKTTYISDNQLKNKRQMVYQRGSQREGSPHYEILYSNGENSGDEEHIPLQTNKSSATLSEKVDVITVLIKAEDTLQALSLRYSCTISELKRINKIHKENEIYALRSIKVPVKAFSILTENLEQTNLHVNPLESNDCEAHQEHLSKLSLQGNNNLMHGSSLTEKPNTEINTIILNSLCEPINSLSSSSNIVDEANSESEQLLTSAERDSVYAEAEIGTFKCSGDNWGISWVHLLIFSLLLGFGGPLLYYIFYITE
ncbi:lysM and putative peptidoglycan-binding domain-containing protein 4 [Prorops nasuta]|uniref:lysM and putative peptidoglycan-binding domain-containing protein 4 n=1 Tax=Prorops nasuta TaxID=863751 RepID=UPI0034CDE341